MGDEPEKEATPPQQPGPKPPPRAATGSGSWGVASLLRNVPPAQGQVKGAGSSGGFAVPKTPFPEATGLVQMPWTPVPKGPDPSASAHDSAATKVSGPQSASNAALSLFKSNHPPEEPPKEESPS